jgi:energy-coupling factor transport system permease protein
VIHGASFAAAGLRPTPLGHMHPAASLGALVLGLAGTFLAIPIFLTITIVLLSAGLAWTGLDLQRQLLALKPWLPVALLVMLVHTLTTVAAAPLGRPSVAGALAGVEALARVVCTVGWLGLFLRVMSLDDLVLGLGWWLRPLARLGVPVGDVGLVLAVALGTAPVVLGEGRRIQTVLRLRRTGPGAVPAGGFKRFIDGLLDRARVIVPLLETLARRGEALSLTLRRRRPDSTAGLTPLPVWQALLLVVWTAGLVLLVMARVKGETA